MPFALSAEALQWVDSVFSSLTFEEKIAQLLHPIGGQRSLEDWEKLLKKVPVGAIFWNKVNPDEFEKLARDLQSISKVPVIMSGDLEHGALTLTEKCTVFSDLMSFGACNNPEYVRQMARITALESRSRGLHWALAPVIDLNLNPENPITNTRAFGDDPDKIIPLFRAFIEGIQQDGLLAACCKHFPGDGVDNRDQHMLTSINSLPFDQWQQLYGRVWKEAIAAGTFSVMAGHISLPDYQGCQDDPDSAMPATLSRELQTDLLRNELGFKGVLVSDAFPMVGFTSRLPEKDLGWTNIQNGSDSLLFADPEKDFEFLLRAVDEGKLTEERINESVKRLLTMKAALNLHKDCFAPALTGEDLARHQQFAEKIADEAVCVIRENKEVVPVAKEKLQKVLTISMLRNDHVLPDPDLETVDAELRARGIHVDHLRNPERRIISEIYGKYDRIFINIPSLSHANLSLQLTGNQMMFFWHYRFNDLKNKFVFTSFGTPYTLYYQPYLDNLICVWGISQVSQKAAVRAWLGEIPMNGKMPVRPHKTRIKRYE